MARNYLFLLVAVLLGVTVSAQHNTQYFQEANQCQWVLKLTTGADKSAATEATISIKILIDYRDVFGQQHHYVAQTITDLNDKSRQKGVKNYLPFKKGQVDYFQFKGPCSDSACTIVFGNGGTGKEPAWQLATAQATVTRPGLPVRELNANVNAWVAKNRPPYNAELSVNFCTGAVTTGAAKPTNHLN